MLVPVPKEHYQTISLLAAMPWGGTGKRGGGHTETEAGGESPLEALQELLHPALLVWRGG
jgi:hypothetical protein